MNGRLARRFCTELALGLLLAAHTIAAPLPPSGTGGPFTLLADGAESLSLTDLRGRLVVLAFGYTHCPDICPTTLAQLGQAMQELGPDADRVQVLFVSLDPSRDTPDRLGPYVRHFDRRFVGLTGPVEEVASVAKHFGVRYEPHRDVRSALGYAIDHSTDLFLIDEQGELAAILPYGVPIDHIIGLIRQLLPDP